MMHLSGCATVPTRQQNLPVYSLNGVKYLPLISYCELKGIEWDYDTFTRTATLTRGATQVSMSVGSPLAVVNGSTKGMKVPADLHNGAIVIPYRFKEEVLDPLFKEEARAEPKEYGYCGRFKKIVIDAGHGGKDSGAIGKSGLMEKNVNLDIATKLNRLLRDAGYDTVLTRDDDTFIPLPKRASIANNCDADLFVSIHSNANRTRSLYGLEVYYISPSVSDSDRALVAAEDAGLDNKDLSPALGSMDVKATVWDMIYASNRAESMDLAKHICNEARGCLPTRVIGIKGAPFYVLKNTRMPALLVEVGFVTNSKEEKMLKSGAYRQQLAEIIAKAIKQFCGDYSTFQAGVK